MASKKATQLGAWPLGSGVSLQYFGQHCGEDGDGDAEHRDGAEKAPILFGSRVLQKVSHGLSLLNTV